MRLGWVWKLLGDALAPLCTLEFGKYSDLMALADGPMTQSMADYCFLSETGRVALYCNFIKQRTKSLQSRLMRQRTKQKGSYRLHISF
jgi:hypothetical protein